MVNKLSQLELIPAILRLCTEGKYNEAIAMTDQIQNKAVAVKAHLLCLEHEAATTKRAKDA